MEDKTPVTNKPRVLKGLAIATVLAIIVLFVVVLPAERNYDPTGIGATLGLTRKTPQTLDEVIDDVLAGNDNLVPAKDLAGAIAISTSAWQFATIVGPVAGGLLYGIAAGAPYAGALILYLAGAVLILGVPPPPQKTGHEPTSWSTQLIWTAWRIRRTRHVGVTSRSCAGTRRARPPGRPTASCCASCGRRSRFSAMSTDVCGGCASRSTV